MPDLDFLPISSALLPDGYVKHHDFGRLRLFARSRQRVDPCSIRCWIVV